MTTKVAEKPILFSAPMVRAILDGRKTQTRRVVKDQSWFPANRKTWPIDASTLGNEGCVKCPYGKPGDRLWVRETWQEDPVGEWGTCYKASGHNPDCKFPFHLWRPSIFMPRKLSRITLEITDVRVERVNEISEADAIAEGTTTKTIDCRPGHSYREAFHDLWDSINGKRPGCAWKDNPWTWCIEFKRVKA